MIKYIWLVLLISGCASVGMKQSECELQYTAFEDIYTCTKTATASDLRTKTNQGYKMYMLKGEQLSQQVREKKISDLDARVEWQNLFIQLKRNDEERGARIRQSTNSMKTTNCVPVGNTVSCTTY